MHDKLKLVSILLLGLSQFAHAIDAQTLNDAVQQKLQQLLLAQHPEARGTFAPVTLHPSVSDKACDAYELKVNQTQWRNQIPVQVRCLQPQWSFYVNVKSRVQLPAFTPLRLMQRDEPLSASNLTRAWFDAATLRQGLLTDLSQIEQRTPRTNLRAGQPVYVHQLKPRQLVNKGDQVTVRAVIGSAGVSSTGIALQNGKLGQQIRIRNISSGRIIKAWVWQAGLVGNRPRGTKTIQTLAAK